MRRRPWTGHLFPFLSIQPPPLASLPSAVPPPAFLLCGCHAGPPGTRAPGGFAASTPTGGEVGGGSVPAARWRRGGWGGGREARETPPPRPSCSPSPPAGPRSRASSACSTPARRPLALVPRRRRSRHNLLFNGLRPAQPDPRLVIDTLLCPTFHHRVHGPRREGSLTYDTLEFVKEAAPSLTNLLHYHDSNAQTLACFLGDGSLHGSITYIWYRVAGPAPCLAAPCCLAQAAELLRQACTMPHSMSLC